MQQRSNRNLGWVYWGTLISSLGTYTFPGVTLGILTELKYPLFKIGLLMALTRLGTIIGSFFLGDLSDKLGAKRVVIWTEVIAFILSLSMIYTWSMGEEFFNIFSLFVFLRFVTISIGNSSKNSLIKSLCEDYKKDHFHSGVTLNVVTYGPGVAGSLIGYLGIKYFSYTSVLAFDAVTFIINGIILYLLVNPQEKLIHHNKRNLFSKIEYYFEQGKTSILDVFLCIPFLGTNVLMSQLSMGVGYRVPLLLMTFGLSVIASAQLLKYFRSETSHNLAYVGLITSFIILYFFNQYFIISFLSVFLRNICYWYLYNLYTGNLQQNVPHTKISSVFAARVLITTSFLGVGEFVLGSFGGTYVLNIDLTFRIAATLLILLFKLRIDHAKYV